MKKSFYFALALTAGLFASCSSDELTSQAPAGLDVNDNEAVAIQIGVAQPGMTRGTGTVGATAAETALDATANNWAGQTFNLFMFKKGTFIPAQKAVDNGNGGTENVDIYNNAEMTTPDNASTGAATYVIGTDQQFNYYPTDGAFSFWAYRVDDAGTGTAGVGEPVGVATYTAGTDTWTDDATEVYVPFTIDGSQDILTAVPDEAADLTTLQQEVPTATADKIYTAYSARRNVKPTLNFKHALTRLTFEVKANSKEVSTAATAVSADPGVYAGFKVTGIAVKSKTNGKIIAAWKTGGTYNDQTVVFDDAAEDWATPANLPALQLKSRGMEVQTKQTNYWSDQISLAVAVDGTVNYTGTYTLGTANYTITAANGPGLELYDVNTENSYTGLPNGTKKTVAQWLEAYIANPANAPENQGDVCKAGTIKGYAQSVNQALVEGASINAAAGLVDLKPVVPGWNGVDASAGSAEVLATIAANTTSNNAAAYTGANGTTVIAVAEDASLDTEAKCEADVKKKTTNATYIYKNGTEYYAWDVTSPYQAAVAASAGQANTEKTKVGEALLVAPDAPSYELVLTYKRWKATSSSANSEIEGSITKTISRSNGANFAAGASYNIVITLYKDGDASTETNLNPWTDGEEIGVDGEDD